MEIEYNAEEITTEDDWDFIAKRIKAEIANKQWGREFYYKILINADRQVKEAMQQFNVAKKL